MNAEQQQLADELEGLLLSEPIVDPLAELESDGVLPASAPASLPEYPGMTQAQAVWQLFLETQACLANGESHAYAGVFTSDVDVEADGPPPAAACSSDAAERDHAMDAGAYSAVSKNTYAEIRAEAVYWHYAAQLALKNSHNMQLHADYFAKRAANANPEDLMRAQDAVDQSAQFRLLNSGMVIDNDPRKYQNVVAPPPATAPLRPPPFSRAAAGYPRRGGPGDRLRDCGRQGGQQCEGLRLPDTR